MKNSNARFWSSRCEDCFSTEQHFLSWKTDCLSDLRVLPGHWSQSMIVSRFLPTYLLLLFEMMKKRRIRFKMGRKIITNDESLIWWHLDMIVQTENRRVWETQDRNGIVRLADSSEGGLDYHRLKTMVKRSIEQSVRNRNFGTRNGNYERNAVVKNQVREHNGQKLLGDCWQWEANGQCSKRDSCSFRHDMNKSFSEFFMKKGWKESKKRSPRRRSTSGSMFRLLCLHQFILWKVATSRLHDQEWKQIWKKALMHNVSLMNNPATGIKIMVTKNAVAMLKKNLHESM